MRIGILETGEPPAHLASFGTYPTMFRKLLEGEGFDFASFDVRQGIYPCDPADCDAYIITGSADDAYGDADWIIHLRRFLNDVEGQVPLVGICFGHQVMAQAFGGRVAKAAAGWGIGLHLYEVADRHAWMGDVQSMSLPASHQDQVAVLPPGADVVAGNAFCPNGVLVYRDRRAISMQLHPEFSAAYAAALATGRRLVVDDAAVDAAIASLAAPADQRVAARWIVDFLKNAD